MPKAERMELTIRKSNPQHVLISSRETITRNKYGNLRRDTSGHEYGGAVCRWRFRHFDVSDASGISVASVHCDLTGWEICVILA